MFLQTHISYLDTNLVLDHDLLYNKHSALFQCKCETQIDGLTLT